MIEGPGLACVCSWDGLLIVACASWDIADAVRRHQATPEHKAARRRVAIVESNRMRRQRIAREVSTVRLLRDLSRERVAARMAG